ncbi:hypothetical protein Rleg_2496 [Rhizobium leguminosarum bv. trifolii WSM1325]|uniref:Uncharacterized protein n=1 Tax=Rhizobium leguminosarum bv. trifolii (strain WSM1325) TaxID=395491 RepID=C6B2R9_RHILS|nr:hypothetical protein Rleg_2496 [Rhizobium leguminosarum bv. trifolii WSM1325]
MWEDRSFDCRALTDDISTESAFPLFAIAQVNSDDRRASVVARGQERTSTSATAAVAKVAKLRTTGRTDLTQAEDDLVTVAYEAGKPSRKAARPQKTIEGPPRSHSGRGISSEIWPWREYGESARREEGKSTKGKRTVCSEDGIVYKLMALRADAPAPPFEAPCGAPQGEALLSVGAASSSAGYRLRHAPTPLMLRCAAPRAKPRSTRRSVAAGSHCFSLEWITGARDVRRRSFGPILEPRSVSRS